MSYDLAVWDGPRPADDTAALDVFEDLYGRFMGGTSEPPTPRIRQYVEGLAARWPGLSADDEDEYASPWSDGPLINNASGPLFYFGMVSSRYQEAASFAASLARMSGLVCAGGAGRALPGRRARQVPAAHRARWPAAVAGADRGRPRQSTISINYEYKNAMLRA
ncbi:hypothetical protein [Streptomyces sp. ME19-01-6]|uniref:hypothetical protein n=1 Tax=Streptomyces sp. ME19-01-6 TaxID=3028686 RepID=UPI0029C9FF20|nr:hypothetical protein [Streptomyces sp. ME19-01-6]